MVGWQIIPKETSDELTVWVKVRDDEKRTLHCWYVWLRYIFSHWPRGAGGRGILFPRPGRSPPCVSLAYEHSQACGGAKSQQKWWGVLQVPRCLKTNNWHVLERWALSNWLLILLNNLFGKNFPSISSKYAASQEIVFYFYFQYIFSTCLRDWSSGREM